MQTRFIVAMVSGLFLISNSAIAQECNHRSGDSAYIMDCIAERYKTTDQELTALYNEAMQSLSDDGRKKLEDAQKSWLKYRDASLKFITEVNRKTGSTGNVIIEDYRLTLTRKRIEELKYVLKGAEAGPAEW